MYDYEFIEKEVIDNNPDTNFRILRQCDWTIRRKQKKGWELIAFIYIPKDDIESNLIGNYTLIFQKEEVI